VSATRIDGEVRSVTVTQAARHTEVKAGFVILATGGFAAGGIARDRDGTLREPLLGLPVHGPQVGAEPTSPRFLGSQPLDRAGVRTDPTGRPLDTAGEPWARNLYAAGAVLAGAVPWREKSGEGVALATAWAVTGAILGGAQ
jgi:glycerol-3-phosphate dehydrogenase subunit B